MTRRPVLGVFVVVVLLGGVLPFHRVAADVNQDAWTRFYNALSQQIGGDARGTTMVTTPRSFGADFPNTGDYEMYSLCNNKPAWSPAYKPSGGLIYDAYKDMVDSLDFEISEATRNKIYAQQIIVDSSHALYTTCVSGLGADWATFHNNQVKSGIPTEAQLSYSDWNAQYGEAKCTAGKLKWQQDVDDYKKLIDAASHSGYQYVTDAWAALADPDGYSTVFDGKNVQNVSACTFSPSAGKTINNWLNGQLNPGGSQFDSNQATSSEWRLATGGGASYFSGAFAFGGSGSYSRAEVDTSSTSFHMSYSWKGMETFTLDRGSWYQGNIISGHKSGPFNKDSPIAKGEVDLWAPDGMLALVPTVAVVVYQPEVTIRLDQSTYHSVKTSWSAASRACVFVFCFSAGASGSTSDQSWDDQSFSFTLKDTSQVPKLIAIVSQVNDPPAAALKSVPTTMPLLRLDATGLQAHGKPVTVSLKNDAISVASDGGALHGTMEVTLSKDFEAHLSQQQTCNEQYTYPDLSQKQVNCINALGLRSFTTLYNQIRPCLDGSAGVMDTC